MGICSKNCPELNKDKGLCSIYNKKLNKNISRYEACLECTEPKAVISWPKSKNITSIYWNKKFKVLKVTFPISKEYPALGYVTIQYLDDIKSKGDIIFKKGQKTEIVITLSSLLGGKEVGFRNNIIDTNLVVTKLELDDGVHDEVSKRISNKINKAVNKNTGTGV